MRVESVRLPAAHGVTLAADAWGDPAARPVLLLHGGGQTRHAWGATARRLGERGWRALALDLRGHGESDWSPDGEYGLDPFVDDLRALRGAFAGPPVVVGASLGGMAGLVAEGERPGSAASALVLVDIAHRMERSGVERIIDFMLRDLEDGFASLEDAAEAVARYLPGRPRPADLEGLRKNLREGADGRWRWHWDPRFMSRASLRGAAEVAAEQVREGSPMADPQRLEKAARALRVPVLLVRGRMSDVVSEDVARDFLALCPGARFADVSEAGHMVAGDRNDAFTDAVVAFLASPEVAG
jgi:pimeloyl-ACP methyl ester carboxylesterase